MDAPPVSRRRWRSRSCRALIAEAQERGFVATRRSPRRSRRRSCRAQQAQELLSYLEEHGIEMLGPAMRPPSSTRGARARGPHRRAEPARGRRAASTRRGRGEERVASRSGPRPAGAPGGAAPARARPHGRAEPRLAAAVPALDRARAAAERRGGGARWPSASSAATWPPSSTWSRPTCGWSSRSPRATWGAG